MRGAWTLAVALGLSACAESRAPSTAPKPLLVRVNLGSISLPQAIEAGWQRLHVVEDSAGHIAVFFRFDGADSTAVGGAEVGDSANVTLHFTPGRYVVTCARRHADGRRHAESGERLEFTVSDSGGEALGAEPSATASIAMHDFAYSGSERWPVGEHLIGVRNDGQEDHQVRMARLMEGVTLRRWLTDTSGVPLDSTVAGMARIGAGERAFFEAVLSKGRYVIYCLIPTSDGEAHIERGMFREIVVE